MQAVLPVTLSYQTESFQDKSCKRLYVTARCLHSIIGAIFYAVVAVGAGILQKSQYKEEYYFRAYYHVRRCLRTVMGYCFYGSKLINFGVNSTGPLKIVESNESDPVEKLASFFGSKFRDWYRNASSEMLPIDTTKLKLKRYGGICLGISLDYISRYRKEFQKTQDATASVRKVSQLYTEKGTVEAHITQILLHAQDMASFKKKINASRNETYKAIDKLEQKFAHYSSLKLLKIKDPLYNDLSNLPGANQRMAIRCSHLARNYGMDVTLKRAFEPSLKCEELESRLKALKPGTYLVSTDVHMRAFIKISDDKSYLHDPSTGTFECADEPGKFLYQTGRALTFFECNSAISAVK